MPFKKGDKKVGGRQKGTVNKTTAQIKDMITALVGNQMEKWPAVIDKMMKDDPAEAMKITGRLIDYVLPKQTKIDLEGELKHKVEKIVIEIKDGNTNGTTHPDN
jgi:hypothetical protein